jgi:hypothetical protein
MMILTQVKERIDKIYSKSHNLMDAYYEAKGYIGGLKEFGVINLGDYWTLKKYRQTLYLNKLDMLCDTKKIMEKIKG